MSPCKTYQLLSYLTTLWNALKISAVCLAMSPPNSFNIKIALLWNISNIWKRIKHQEGEPTVVKFISLKPSKLLGYANLGLSLVNETFEMYTLCHLQELHRGARQVDPRRSGILSYITTLPKTIGCAVLRSYLRVSPTKVRTRRRRSPNNTEAAVLRSSSPPRGQSRLPTIRWTVTFLTYSEEWV